jgi:hypothetical protein
MDFSRFRHHSPSMIENVYKNNQEIGLKPNGVLKTMIVL